MHLRPPERPAVAGAAPMVGRHPPPALRSLAVALMAAFSAPSAHAQAGTGLTFAPYVTVEQTVTNNVDLSPTAPRSDAITRLTAGISFGSRSGQIRGYFDYGLTANLYARNSDRNSISNQNALRANFDTELIDRRLYVGVSASIGQTAESAFGPQPGLSGLPSTNVTEYRTLTVTPRLKGPLGPAAEYTAGLAYTVSNASGTSKGDSTSATGFVQLRPSSPGVVGWSVDLTTTRSDYAEGRATVDNRILGTLSRRFDALDLLVSISGGAESTNASSLEATQHANYGIGATWAPSPRTNLVAQFDERFFGRAQTVRFEHRTALTSWTLSDTRSLNSTGNGIATVGRGATFDLYYAQFAAIEPDPAKRTDLVNAFLKANGLSASTGADASFLRSGQTIVHGQSASVAYRGLRGGAVLGVSRSATVPIENGSLPSQDFAGTTHIVSDNVFMSLSHRLTPTSSANLNLLYQRSHGDQPEQYSDQREIRLQYATQLTNQSSVTAGARRALYKTYQTPYNESAAFATFGYRF